MIAAAAVAAAWVVRAAIHGLVADQAPYPTFVLAVVFTTIFAGWRNGLAAAVVGGLLGNVSFVAPPGVLHLTGAPRIALVSYFVICGIFIWIMQSFTTSHRAALALNEQLTILGHEYRHRIKNLLAMTQAIIQQTGCVPNVSGPCRAGTQSPAQSHLQRRLGELTNGAVDHRDRPVRA